MSVPRARPIHAIGALLAAALATALAPAAAVAHDNCARATSLSASAAVLGALLPTATQACESKYAGVRTKLVRD